MKIELSDIQLERQEEAKSFIDKEIYPFADQFDRDGRIPQEKLDGLTERGYWGVMLPEEYGGLEWDMGSIGLLCEEIGRGSASLLSIFTVHGMFAQTVLRWGSDEQKADLLPRLATGEILGAFALSEPQIGSDPASVETVAEQDENGYMLNGTKKWISFGLRADVFVLVAQCEGQPTAFILEKSSPNLIIDPINGMLGFRSAMLAELRMENCLIPAESMLGGIGFGFTWVAGTALDFGRYSIACGCVGMAQACLDECLSYIETRRQGGRYLGEYQLIQRMIAEMITNTKAARLLCWYAGYLKDTGDPKSILDTSAAKYFAGRTVFKIASDAVQIHGANGCHEDYPVQRFLRDAKIMEIIEGSNQIQQLLISKYGRV